METVTYQHVIDAWDDQAVAQLSPLERLVYRSNLLGSDLRITNTGGGNTSSKVYEQDPISGESTDVLWVKGSGGDLRTAKNENFASLYMDRLIALQPIYTDAPDNGVKTEIEDRMVGLYRHCTFNLNPRASSIDTALHAFVKPRHVDHMHPNAVIAIAAAKNSERLTQEVWGDDILWTPWQRPGFDLGLVLQTAFDANTDLKGILLGQHGIINWADDDKECYYLTLDLIEKAADYIEARDKGAETFAGQKYTSLPESERDEVLISLLPWLRGTVSQQNRFIGTVQCDEKMMRFVNSHDAARLAELGTSCPDHFLRTKIKPLYVDWDPATRDVDALKAMITERIDSYRNDYETYYTTCRRPDSPAMRDPNPTVILIPGVGMVTWGKNKSESRVTAEFYNCAVEVMRGAEAIDEYVALPQQEAFDIEYWALEEAKLKRMPPEKAFARRIIVVIGAGSGIGRAVALRVASEGAHIVCADRDLDAAQATADAITNVYGVGVGVSGTGISGCGPATAIQVDITDRASIQTMLGQAMLAYGGIDDVVVTAGIYVPPDDTGHVSDEAWKRTFDINVMGAYLVADEASRVWSEQGLDGNLVLTTSVNGVVAKKGSLAYDASKAAANHLVRELALELAPDIRVNALAPATVVDGSSMFPRDRVIASLQKYAIDHDESDSTETLRDRLAKFYAKRTLLGEPISTEHQAEAVRFLLSDGAARTTGQILTVDGGLEAAFLR